MTLLLVNDLYFSNDSVILKKALSNDAIHGSKNKTVPALLTLVAKLLLFCNTDLILGLLQNCSPSGNNFLV